MYKRTHMNQLSQRGTACYFHSPVREKWRCQSPELSDSSQSQALNSTNPPIRKIRAPLMPRTSLSQSRHSFWSQPPLVLIDTISPPSPQQIALVKGLWALCLWGCAGIIPRSSVLLAGLQDGWCFSVSVYCNTESGWDWRRESCSQEWSVSRSPVAGYGSLKYQISIRRGLKQLVMGSKLRMSYCEKCERHFG